MASALISQLANPNLVASFQRWCGVEFVVCEDNQGPEATRLQALEEINARPAVNGSAKNGVCPAFPERRKPSATIGLKKKSSSTTTSNNNSINNNNNNNDCSKPGSLHCKNGIDHEVVKNGFDRNHHHHVANGLITGMKAAKKSDVVNNHAAAVLRKVEPGCANGSAPTSPANRNHHLHNNHHLYGGRKSTRVSIRWPILYYWARVGAFLGNEEFYLTGLPFLIWAVDSAMLRQTIVVWWLVMYLGQAGKDYFAWPRPPTPPVLRLETEHLAEYSMPSTHAMAGTAIPLLLARLLLQRYQLPTVPVVGLAFLWCFTTCLSRLYLGVHSVLDVLSGFLVSLTLYFAVSPLVAGYDLYQQTHPLSPLVLVLTSLALCTVCYPAGPGVKTTGKSDAITTTAVVAGLGVGFWLNFQLEYTKVAPMPAGLPVPLPSFFWLATSLLQFVLGVVVVYAVKLVMKRLTVRFFSHVCFGLDRPDAQHPGVMVGATYTTYLCLGLVIAFFDPLIFSALGIGRPAFYLEVL